MNNSLLQARQMSNSAQIALGARSALARHSIGPNHDNSIIWVAALASFLIGWRDRLAGLGDATNTVPLPMGRQAIADFLGLTIKTVGRTFTKLERDGLIEIVPAGVCVPDLERLQSLTAA